MDNVIERDGKGETIIVYDVKDAEYAHLVHNLMQQYSGYDAAEYTEKQFVDNAKKLSSKNKIIFGGKIELPDYRKIMQHQKTPTEITVVYDGKAPYEAAENIFEYIRDSGHRVDFKDAKEYLCQKGNFGRVIIVGHHELAKKQLQHVEILYDRYGMKFGYNVNQCVLTTEKNWGKGKRGDKGSLFIMIGECLSIRNWLTGMTYQ